jgi:hypothetical protein
MPVPAAGIEGRPVNDGTLGVLHRENKRREMTSVVICAVGLMLGVTLSGCAPAAKTIAGHARSERTDVFTAVLAAAPIPDGFAEGVIAAYSNTRFGGVEPVASPGPARGCPAYLFLVNIDGEAVQWSVEGTAHHRPASVNGLSSRGPQARDGVK